MTPTITCKGCGSKISIDEALLHEIKDKALREINQDHQLQIKKLEEKIKNDSEQRLKEQIEELKSKITLEANEKAQLTLKQLQEETNEEKAENKKLRESLNEVMQQLRLANKERDNTELQMQKKLADEEAKIKEDAQKSATEKFRLEMASREKTISDLQKSLDEAQRKAAQGSQQMQGEILELDLEEALDREFRDDGIQPIAKGTNGADVRQIVKSPRGTACGIILWETKRTKTWSDQWTTKLKADMRAEGANCPVIITEIMPKNAPSICNYQGVWVCKPSMAIVLAKLLRDGLLAVGREKAIAQHRGTAADSLYNYVTSHEFAHHIESILDTYEDMQQQIGAERKAMERIWKKREDQLKILTTGVASVYGSMESRVGSSMHKVKGLELPEMIDEESQDEEQ